MEAEYWILSILAVVVALVAGFIGGRMSSASQREVEAMARERDEAREEAENVRAEVNRHFEDSARMFGKLASDYRTFFQQFSRTAQNLGLSEGRARELLQQADPSLVSGRGAGSASDAGAPVDEVPTEHTGAGPGPAASTAESSDAGGAGQGGSDAAAARTAGAEAAGEEPAAGSGEDAAEGEKRSG